VKQKRKMVEIELTELKLLCLNVDYRITSKTRDMVEELSLEIAKKFKFDTHKFRNELKKLGFEGAV
jgi:hypothetical protein